jgi:putative NADPH-quinone reductase
MRCLIVVAHPLKPSLCQSLATIARETLIRAGHEVDVADLYAETFPPVMTAEERIAHNATPDNSGPEAQRLAAAEVLVLVFPTWWYGFPAVLKGWFDRVWLPGLAFDIAPGTGALLPRLTGLRHFIAITTLGSPRWVDWFVLRRPVRRVLKHAIAGTCARQARFRYLAMHSADDVAPARFETFAARIRRLLSAL